MKTLRNTLVIALAVFSLSIVSAYAGNTTGKPVASKGKTESEENLRKVIVDALKKSTIEETGKVDILFKINAKKQIEVLNVIGENKTLVKSVRNYLGNSSIVVPEAEENKYTITASLNPAPETPNVLRSEISYVLNRAAIAETGNVKIVFEVNSKKEVEILNVFGANASLVYAVQRQLNFSNITAPKAKEGKYIISAKF